MEKDPMLPRRAGDPATTAEPVTRLEPAAGAFVSAREALSALLNRWGPHKLLPELLADCGDRSLADWWAGSGRGDLMVRLMPLEGHNVSSRRIDVLLGFLELILQRFEPWEATAENTRLPELRRELARWRPREGPPAIARVRLGIREADRAAVAAAISRVRREAMHVISPCRRAVPDPGTVATMVADVFSAALGPLEGGAGLLALRAEALADCAAVVRHYWPHALEILSLKMDEKERGQPFYERYPGWDHK